MDELPLFLVPPQPVPAPALDTRRPEDTPPPPPDEAEVVEVKAEKASSVDEREEELDEADEAWLGRLHAELPSRRRTSFFTAPTRPVLAATLAAGVIGTVLLLAFLGARLIYTNPTCPHVSRVVSQPPLSATSYDADYPTSLDSLVGTSALPNGVGANLHLTHAQCDVAFPLLWPQLNRTVKRFRAKGGVRLEDVDRAERDDGTRVTIVDGSLYVMHFHPEYMTRVQAVLASLYEAVLTSPEPMPDVDFYFRAKDGGAAGSHFELDTRYSAESEAWLVPDFGFFSWPEPVLTGYKGVRRQIEAVEASLPWALKLRKLFWRGVLLAPLRAQLAKISDSHPSWGDVAAIDWSPNGGRVSLPDHCRSAFLAHSEGNDAYSGRLKYLLNCRSVVVAHRLRWNQHFHASLVDDENSPDQNIVIVPGESWEALPEVMEKLLADPERAERIAENAWRTLHERYLTQAATSCYWRRVLREYAALQQFDPEIGSGKDYESFVLMGQTKWDPHK